MAPENLPTGLYWSNPITAPLFALDPLPRDAMPWVPAGIHDFTTVAVGDNLSLAPISGTSGVTLALPCTVAIAARYAVNEASSGYLMLRRGCINGVWDEWKTGGLPNGQIFPRFPAPVRSHLGQRYDRYARNGHLWHEESYYPSPSHSYWQNGEPYGAKLRNSTQHAAVGICPPCDVTILSAVPNQNLYISISYVDCLGRETACSPVCCVSRNEAWGAIGTVVTASRYWPLPKGTQGVYVYAGFSPDSMTRQPVLNYEGAAPKYLWPKWIEQYVLNQVIDSGIHCTPAAQVANPLNEFQHALELGEYPPLGSEFDLYCPIDLLYDLNDFGRHIGSSAFPTTFIHKYSLNGWPILADIPLLHLENQRDYIEGLRFHSEYASAGVSFSDYSGGQAMGITLKDCEFSLTGPESVGIVVDERSSVRKDRHTCSELTVDNCSISATIPAKLEGNQTAKIRFRNNCEFGATGNTRYPADTVGTVYNCTSGDVKLTDIKGINGVYRSAILLYGIEGDARAKMDDIYIDGGCHVFVTFAGFHGGRFELIGGGAINFPQAWQRSIEAPISRNVRVIFDGVRMDNQTSAIDFLLNQLSITSDTPLGEVVTPIPSEWVEKNLPLVTDQGFDYRLLPSVNVIYGQQTEATNVRQVMS